MRNCEMCEFKKVILSRAPQMPTVKICEIKDKLIKYPTVKAKFCKWFTLDSRHREAIEKYNEIQAIR